MFAIGCFNFKVSTCDINFVLPFMFVFMFMDSIWPLISDCPLGVCSFDHGTFNSNSLSKCGVIWKFVLQFHIILITNHLSVDINTCGTKRNLSDNHKIQRHNKIIVQGYDTATMIKSIIIPVII